jgi:hypothetical protein
MVAAAHNQLPPQTNHTGISLHEVFNIMHSLSLNGFAKKELLELLPNYKRLIQSTRKPAEYDKP